MTAARKLSSADQISSYHLVAASREVGFARTRCEGCVAAQERTAKRAKLKEEDATAYIQAGTLPDGGEETAPVVTDLSKDAKV